MKNFQQVLAMNDLNHKSDRRTASFVRYARAPQLTNPRFARVLANHGLYYSPTEHLVRCCSCFGSAEPETVIQAISSRGERDARAHSLPAIRRADARDPAGIGQQQIHAGLPAAISSEEEHHNNELCSYSGNGGRVYFPHTTDDCLFAK